MQFTDQVDVLANWFKNWNECEQTVALYSLLKRVKKCQAKFLSRCLDYSLIDCEELQLAEAEANNPEFVSRLMNVPKKSDVISILLSHLPLLQPDNERAKNCYLEVLPKVLGYAIERSEFLEESRQLLSYSLIHPAFDNKQRRLLTTWMAGLDGKTPPDANRLSVSPGELSPENNSATNSLETGASLSDWNHNKILEDASPNPQAKEYHSHYGSEQSLSSAASTLENAAQSIPSSSSTICEPVADGMTDVKSWLKSLRLHKYANLFSPMTYDEMMNLSTDTLDAKNVTKGAKNKIILSIKKLHERFSQLQSLENEILGGGSLRSALMELKTIIQTPIKRFELTNPAAHNGVGGASKREVIEDGDIPSLYTKVMGKACTQLLVSKPNEDNITLYLKLLERCLQHTAFTEVQKRRLRSWKQQVNKMYRSLPRNTRPPQSRSQPNVGYPGIRRPLERLPFAPMHMTSSPRPLNPLSPPPMRPMAMFPPQNHLNWYANASSLNAAASPPTLDSARRAASLDPRLGQRMFEDDDDDLPTSEINTRLDSLSISVAEHALADGVDSVSTL